MPLVDSLLTAVVRSDGDALVLHVGEKPYVVAAAGPVELSRQGLGLGAMEGMLAQLLSADALRTLREMGAVEHELDDRPASSGDRFTVVAARGGDDIWIELRRHRRVPATVSAPPPAPPVVAAVPEPVVVPEPPPVAAPPPAPVVTEPAIVARVEPVAEMPRVPMPVVEDPGAVIAPPPAAFAAAAPHVEAPAVTEPEPVADDVYELPAYEPEAMDPIVVAPVLAEVPVAHHAAAELVALEAAADAVVESDGLNTELDVPMLAVADTAADALPTPLAVAEVEPVAVVEAAPIAVVEAAPVEAPAVVEFASVVPEPVAIAPEPVAAAPEPVILVAAPAPAQESEPVIVAAPAVSAVPVPVSAPAPEPVVVAPAPVLPEPVVASSVAPPPAPVAAPVSVVAPPAPVSVSVPTPMPVVEPVIAARAVEPVMAADVAVRPIAVVPDAAPLAPRPTPVAVPTWSAATPIESSEPHYVPESHPMLPGLASELDAMDRDAEASLSSTESLPAVVLSLTRDGARGSGGGTRGTVRPGGIERLLRLAAARGASALYLTTQARPAVRVDGDIRLLDGEPALSSGDVEAAVLELAPEGARDKESAEWIRDLADVGRVRITTFRDYRGPGALLRMIQAKATSAEQLGLVREIQALATEPEGLVIVTGPRASGKSTLVSAFVDLINRQRSDYVITLEGQIRLVHESRGSLISQRELRGNAQEVVSAARAALRENPDVLVIEDLRSPDVLQVALDAAGSGLLVFASVTAASATAALERLVDLCPSDQRRNVRAALAEHLRGVVAQVLLRKAGGGRLAARELVLNTSAVAALISDGQIAQLPRAIDSGRKLGMAPLNDALVAFVQSGAVDVREAYRKADDKAGLLALLRREGIDTSFVERLA